MGHLVWTPGETRRIIPDQETFWLSDCECRAEKGGRCKKGMRVCLGFSESDVCGFGAIKMAPRSSVENA